MGLATSTPDSPKAFTLPIGAASPLWLAFAGVASAGVAFWWMTRWTRTPQGVASTAALPKALVDETPVVEAPLTRLGVVKNDADFTKRANSFIPLQESPDDDTPQDAAGKEQARDQARHDLIKEALDAADPLLVKAEAAL